MTNLITQEDLNALLKMPQVDAQKTAAQMMALMSGMAAEKENIDSMTTMLEKQPWYKKCIKTITGKNKATVKEISEHKDKIMSYTSNALAYLYENNKIEQQQIIALGEAVNSVNGQLAATNYELLKTQAALNDLKTELISSISGLANALNEKIISVGNYDLLLEEIKDGDYNSDNVIESIFRVIAQIDRHTAADKRKLKKLKDKLTKKGYLNDKEQMLKYYMHLVAALPDDIAWTIYYEFYCLTDNTYAAMFAELMQSYVFLPKLEKKSKKVDKIIDGILEIYDADPDTPFTTNDLYDYFIESKIDYLTSIQDANVVETTAVEQPQAQIAAETTADAPAPDALAPFMPEATETAAEPAAEKTETVTDTATAGKTETETAADTVPAVESEPDAPAPFMPETKEAAAEPAAEPAQPGADETAGLEDLVIDSILQIPSGETYEISNKTVRFARSVTCDGTLSLKNCVVYYNDTNANGTVKLSFSAKICAENCTFICCGYSSELYFIHGDYGSAVFTNCVFNDCMYFVECRELSISSCTLNNCAGSFAYVYSIEAKDIKILNTKMPDFIDLPADDYDNDDDDDEDDDDGQFWGAVIYAGNGTITGAYVEASDAFNSAQKAVGRYNSYFCGGKKFFHGESILRNSKFVNCNSCFDRFSIVKECQFEKCGYHRFLSRASDISGCKFTDCNGPLLYDCRNVSFCEFINCTNYSAGIYARNFISVDGRYISIISSLSVSSGCTKLSNCCFENTDAFDGFIVHVGSDGETLSKNDEYHLSVENCDFINCRTRRSSGAVIKTYYRVWKKKSALSTKTVDETCVDISECKGLDSIKIVDDDDILEVEDVFKITGRGTVLTGTVQNKSISTGSRICVNGNLTMIKGIEHQSKIVDRAEPGDEVGILIDLKKNEVNRGDVVYLV